MANFIGIKEDVIVFFNEGRIIIKNIYSDAYFLTGMHAGIIFYLMKADNMDIDILLENISYLFNISITKAQSLLYYLIENFNDYIKISETNFKRGKILLNLNDIKQCKTFKELKKKREFPSEVTLYLTKYCIRRCLYCKEKACLNSTVEKDNFFSDIDRIEKLIYGIENKVVNWTFTGGEPFLHPNIIHIARLLKSKSSGYISLVTKGTSNLYILKKLCNEKLIDVISFSLDSMNPSTVEYLSGDKHTYYDILRCINLVKNFDIEMNINAVLTSKNYLDIEKLVEFCKLNKIPKIVFICAMQSGRCQTSLMLNDTQIYACKQIIGELAIRYKGYVLPVLKIRNKNDDCYNCSSLYERLILKPDGSAELCNGNCIGTVVNSSINQLWRLAQIEV